MENTYVGGTGPLGAKIAFVGEQPAKYEAKYGKPFTGPAGQNLDECLREARIRRSEVYLTNVVKECGYDIKAYIKITSGTRESAKPTNKLWGMFVEELQRELIDVNPNVIVPLGNSALWALCDRANITMWRGSVIESKLLPGKKVIPCLHPASYTQDKLFKAPEAYLNKFLIIMDLKKVKRESEYPEIRLTNRKVHMRPSYPEALEFIADCMQRAKEGVAIDYDIELDPGSQELSCISFAISPTEAFCIPFMDQTGNYFTPEQELKIMRRLDELFRNSGYAKGGQNIGFDSHYMLRKYGIRTRNIERDTMVAQRILYPEFSRMHGGGARLNFITAMWTDIPYYKADGKMWLSGITDWEKGWQYNGLDSISCADAFPKQLNEIEERGLQETYQRQVRLIPALTYMMEHGIRVDVNGIKDEYIKNLNAEVRLEEQLNRLVGREFNPRSPKQVAQLLYNERGFKPRVKDGKVTTNSDALLYMMSKGCKEAELILKIRKSRKYAKTFLNPDKVDKDGRIRCSYNPVGTKFGRISSSRNIFGTGINLTNVPHSVLSHFLVDKGYVGYSLDMSQIENRFVAYVGNITEMKEVYEKGQDSHTKTAALIFHNGDLSKVKLEYGSCPLGDGTHDERFWGKKANHGFNYGFGPQSFSDMYDVPLNQAKWIHSAYHKAYPALEKGYWAYVQDQLKRTRTLTNLLGRKTLFLGKWEQNMLNAAYSCIPQGSNADHMNERGIEFIYYNTDPLFKPVELLTYIHDSLEFQLPLSLPLVEHAKVILKIKESLETPFRWRNEEFVVPCDLTVNFCLNKELGVEIKGKEFSQHQEILADKILLSIIDLEYGLLIEHESDGRKYTTFHCGECREEIKRNWTGRHELLVHTVKYHSELIDAEMAKLIGVELCATIGH